MTRPSDVQPQALADIILRIESEINLKLIDFVYSMPFGSGAIYHLMDFFENDSDNLWNFVPVYSFCAEISRNVDNIEFVTNPYYIAFKMRPDKQTICLVSTQEEAGIVFTNSSDVFRNFQDFQGFSMREFTSSMRFFEPRTKSGYFDYIQEWIRLAQGLPEQNSL